MSVSLQGHLELRAEVRGDGRTVLARQSFRVPYHVGKGYTDAETGVLHVQVANPTAGILAGDELRLDIGVGEGARLLLTTPSASRVFQMREGAAQCEQRFAVAAGGWLEMLPEPLVPHRQSVYRQRTLLELAEGAGVFFVDQLMPGRIGHGEAWEWRRLVLDLEVQRQEVTVLRERLDQSGESLRALAEAAGTGRGSCFANAVWAPGGADLETGALAERLRSLHAPEAWFGATEVVPGVWSLRWVARDGIKLREALAKVRSALAEICPPLRTPLRKV